MNQLKNATSLYLKQHQDNPVQWRMWGKAALDEAKQKNLPILLSSGYAACHWCHVMAHESFEDEAIAKIINDNFIAIKIDREERPEIDAIYMGALHNLGQQGGWPLTMFLDEEANPFWGGTYFPNPPRGGMIGFTDVLNGVVRLWNEQKEDVIKNRDALQKTALENFQRKRQGTIELRLLKRMAEQLKSNFDLVKGGLRGAPKFPNLPLMTFLWNEAVGGAKNGEGQVVIKTLEAICLGGIYDHIGGGVARYAVDENWFIPHFEKMLYDNGQLIWFLSEVYRETQNPMFAKRVEEIVNFLQRDMLLAQGFAASLDADSLNADGEKQEGAFYVWDQTQIDDLLKEKAPAFKKAYGIQPTGNWVEEKTNVLFLTHYTDNFTKEKQILFDARAKRNPPALDDKVIASWNGLTIAALAHASWVFDKQNYLALAKDVFARVENALLKNGRLAHSYCAGSVIAPALLDDIAAMGEAALALYFITQEKNYLAAAKNYLAQAQEYHKASSGESGGGGGGFNLSAKDAKDIPLEPICEASDDVMPAANGLVWRLAAKLFVLEQDEKHRILGEEILASFGADVVKNFSAHATWLVNFRNWQKLFHIVLVADDGSLEAALKTLSLPHTPFIKMKASEDKTKPALNGSPTAYVCLGNRCLAPIGDEKVLVETLLKERQSLE